MPIKVTCKVAKKYQSLKIEHLVVYVSKGKKVFAYFSPMWDPPEDPPPELLRDVLRSLALE